MEFTEITIHSLASPSLSNQMEKITGWLFFLFFTWSLFPSIAHAQLITVRGEVNLTTSTMILPHEHLLVDFIGAGEVGEHRYDRDAAFEMILPHLHRLRETGVGVLVECTPALLGRDVQLLHELSRAADIHILTNTGYYAAANFHFLPWNTHQRSAADLADEWIAEWRDGIDGTGIRPGFVKIGVDAAPLPDVSLEIIRAAAITHRETGLVIACHAPDGAAIVEAVGIFEEESIPLDALIWVHANMDPNTERHLRLARMGVWVEYDGISPQTLELHRDLVLLMRNEGLLHRVLLSHDAGWYSVGEPGGGEFRFFGDLQESLIPMLLEAGLASEEVHSLVRDNPLQAFTPRERE
ncbi:MAG: phosphotriesterase [Candidatus Sumerlaeia bacterium]|nr:phosphotriesterase [Candidatus Sumerlaeia bacterium]